MATVQARARKIALPALPFGRGAGESIRIAVSSLRANKLRTLLTMLGIIIGVASVVALLSIGRGATSSITSQISSIGSNLLTISPGMSFGSGGVRSSSNNLTMADAEVLASLPGVAASAPVYQGNSQIIAGSNNTQSTVLGVTDSFFTVRNAKIDYGTLITQDQSDSMESVAVLGSGVAEDLFSTANPIGSSIRINNQIFRVIGVLKSAGGTGNSIDDQVMVPLKIAQLKLFGARSSSTSSLLLSTVYIQVSSADLVDGVQDLAEKTLRVRHKLSSDGTEDDFRVFNQADVLESLSQVTTILTVFLGSIAGISLLVGGIGVMNIMLVSVSERTKEIGLRKAVGARRSDIMQQFLVEALLVSVLGGIVGVLLGVGVAYIVKLTGVTTPVVTADSIFLSLGFSMAVGLFFGIYPARRAARLRPIEALRYE
ncbi:FtsX-like permease family protein [Chloroflexia bacterium SDU3-3]|nr:FtsX-like permease family protein [Chloroflexia bacterium SDU3-3]